MPRYNIEYNGKWACFTSITDGFITGFMDKLLYEEWRKGQYGEHGYKPLEECNAMTMKEAAFSIRLNRTPEEALQCLLECGLPEAECRQIVYDMETDYYCPIPKENGEYECPNCRRKVVKDQLACTGEDCDLDFVWR